MGDRAEKTAFAQITRRRMTQDGNFNFWAMGVPKEQGRSKQGVGDANWVEYLHRGTFVVEELPELPSFNCYCTPSEYSHTCIANPLILTKGEKKRKYK